MRRQVIRASIGVVALVLLAIAGLFLIPPYPSVMEAGSVYDDEKIAAKMDPWLLAEGLVKKLTIEVDWVEGCEPGPLALRGLKSILETYGPPGRVVEINRDDEIPRREWDAAENSSLFSRAEALVDRYASPVSSDQIEHRYVLYAPSSASLFGFSSKWLVKRDDQVEMVRGVVVFHERHAFFARLWIDVDKFERMTLIHEFGHQFGLVSDPRHERSDFAHRGHCVRLDCLMAHPTPRVILRNIPRGVIGHFFHDYCEECQSEIRTAQSVWRKQRAVNSHWSESLRQKRAEDRQCFAIGTLLFEKRYEEVLSQVDEALLNFPASTTMRYLRIRALVGLDEIDQALDEWRTPVGEELRELEIAQGAWALGRALVTRGRRTTAYRLLKPFLMKTQNDYLFEQSLFVARRALEGCGRYSEAADWMLELQTRGHHLSISPVMVRREAAALLRKAGRLSEADGLIESLLQSKKRSAYLEEASRLYFAQGRQEEARTLLGELLELNEELARSEQTPRVVVEYANAAILARLGREAESRELMAEAALAPEDPPGSREQLRRDQLRARAYAALGEFDAVAEFWRGLESSALATPDPCTEESLSPLRGDSKYEDLFRNCCLESAEQLLNNQPVGYGEGFLAGPCKARSWRTKRARARNSSAESLERDASIRIATPELSSILRSAR